MRQEHRAAGLDWLDIWRRMYDEEREQAERATSPGFQVGADYWANQAGRFAAAARRSAQPDAFLQHVLGQLRPNDTVLDIGAGTGRYVPTLARACARLIALEPSPAMRGHLEQRIADERLDNVSVVAEGWPAPVPQCDVVISAHVVYAVREIGPFLQAMDAAARRACFMFLAIRHPASFISPLWERVHGEPRHHLPGALECLCALHQLGITARMELVPTASRITFASADEALEDVRFRLRLPPGPRSDAVIGAAIEALFERADDGTLAPLGQPSAAAVISWERSVTLGGPQT
jgi:SAM-dependent methyltransferase